MAATKYTYSLTSDFPETGLNSSRMVREIQVSSITVALDRIDTNGDDCDIWFKDALGTADKTVLDGDTSSPAGGLIAAHSGQPLEVVTVAPVILEPTGNSAKNLQIVGTEFEADLNGETQHAVQFSEERDIQGLNIAIANHQAGPNGDSVRIAIQAPDGQGGWVDYRALARGVSAGSSVPVPASGSVSVVSEGTATLPTALRILVTYNCVKTSGDKPVVHILFRTWL